MPVLGHQRHRRLHRGVDQAEQAVDNVPAAQRTALLRREPVPVSHPCLKQADGQVQDAGGDQQRGPEPVQGPAEPPGGEDQREKLHREERIDLPPGQQVKPDQLLAQGEVPGPHQRPQVCQRHLQPALRPALALKEPVPRLGRGQLEREDGAVVDQPPARQQGADAGVDVLRQHRRVHPHVPQGVAPPVAVGAAEDRRPADVGAALMRDGVDAVELHGDGPRQPVLREVADHAAALHDVVSLRQPAPRLAEAVRLRQVVGVIDGNDLPRRHCQGRIHVLRLAPAVRDPQQAQARVVRRQVPQDILDGQRLRRVVGQDNLKAVRRNVHLSQHVLQGLQNDVLLVRQVGGDDRRAGRQVAFRAGRRQGRQTPRRQGLPDDHQAGHGVDDDDDGLQAREEVGEDLRPLEHPAGWGGRPSPAAPAR